MADRPTADDDLNEDDESKYQGMIYGMIAGMMLGTLLFVMTDNILFMTMGFGVGMIVGLLIDAARNGGMDKV